MRSVSSNLTIRFPRLEAGCRYFICLLMLIYGSVKLFHGQFYTDAYWKDAALGQLSGMQLVWSFYSYSPIYETFIGAVEVAIALLILFPRTTALGVVLFLSMMANLVAINIIYEVGALASAGPLLLAGLVLFVLHFQNLKRAFWNQDDSVVPAGLPMRAILPKAVVILIGCSLAATILYNNKLRFKSDPELKGAWTFAEASPLHRIYFEKGRTCVLQDKSGNLHFARYQTNGNKSLSVTDAHALLAWQKRPYEIENNLLVVSTAHGRQLLRRQGIATPLPDDP